MFVKSHSVLAGSVFGEKSFVGLVDGTEQMEHRTTAEIERISGKRQCRRMDRISLLGEVLMEELMKGFSGEQVQAERIGCVLNTAYGCLDTNLKFIREFLSDNDNDISANDFAHTVYNAVLGHMCMNYHMKGPGTMLLSSNFLFPAMQMLRERKADYMVAGGIEAYLPELESYMNRRKVAVCEAGCLLLLGRERAREDLCEIVDYSAAMLSGHPYMTESETAEFQNQSEKKIEMCLRELIRRQPLMERGPQLIASSMPLSGFADLGMRAAEQVFPDTPVVSIRRKTGETFGASLAMAVLYAALRLRRDGGETAVINHLDISGAFVSYLICR